MPTPTPTPGKPARGTRTGRPDMVLLDLLGRRWTLRILWELRESTLTFRQLQDSCDRMSPSVLNRRLAELKESRFVELTDDGYRLTALGAELHADLRPLHYFAKRWARAMEK